MGLFTGDSSYSQLIKMPLQLFAGFSILSGVEILFYVCRFFFSLRKYPYELNQKKEKTKMTCAEIDKSVQLEEQNINS